MIYGLRFSTTGCPLIFCLMLIAGCASGSGDFGEKPDFIASLSMIPNPSGYAPLTAEIAITASRPVQLELIVKGRDGAAGDVRHRFDGMIQQDTLPVLGLYPDFTNTIILNFYDGEDKLLGETIGNITTPELHPALPSIVIDTLSLTEMKPGMNLVSYLGYDKNEKPQRPFMFDTDGDIRWYLDFTGHPRLKYLHYSVGIERLANGNLYFGDKEMGRIVEMDMLGRIINTWHMPGYDFHHNVEEKPNGNFLATVVKLGEDTVDDYLIEINRKTGEIVREWNLKLSLDKSRKVWDTDLYDTNVDWFHGNAVTYDPSDSTIIVSGRNQGTIKLTGNNEVVWIIAPHLGWGMSGNGIDLSTRLLQPLDANGKPITENSVLEGHTNHPEFEWAWYQHAPELLPDGTLLLFDNGDNRNYTGDSLYSRAVVYSIDPTAMTIKQIWDYGKERGEDAYSQIVSDVDFYDIEGNIVFMPGSIDRLTSPSGKMIEVDFVKRNLVFEATITPPKAPFGITFHRIERLSLYPQLENQQRKEIPPLSTSPGYN